MVDFLNQIVFIFGLGVFSMTSVMAAMFFQWRNTMSQAFGWVFLAMAVATASTIIFSITTVFGLYRSLDPFVVIALRVFIFGSIGGAAVNAWLVVRKVRDGQ